MDLQISREFKFMAEAFCRRLRDHQATLSLQVLKELETIPLNKALELFSHAYGQRELDSDRRRIAMRQCLSCLWIILLGDHSSETDSIRVTTGRFSPRPRMSPATFAPVDDHIATAANALPKPQKDAWCDFWAWLQELGDPNDSSSGFGQLAQEVIRRSLRE